MQKLFNNCYNQQLQIAGCWWNKCSHKGCETHLYKFTAKCCWI